MISATVNELKQELSIRSHQEIRELCIQLAKFKKENKELLTYLLYESTDEATFIANVKSEIDVLFSQINTTSYYFVKKSVRKILRIIKKYIRYSKKKETEVELLLYFCGELKQFDDALENSTALRNLFIRQMEAAKKAISFLHEDLQYDYKLELEQI